VADTKISALTELTTPASADELVVVDKSDTTMAASGTDKRITYDNVVFPGVGRVLLLEAHSLVLHDQAAATLGLVDGGYASAAPSFNTSAAAPTGGSLPKLRYNATDHDRTGFLTQFLLRAQVSCNATSAASITFTFGVYPVTVAGAADTVTYTLGGVVTGTTTTAIAGTVSNITNGASAVQDMTGVTGTYCLGCVTSGTLPNNSAIELSAQLYRLYAYA
jgi:hypothetical protein